MPQKLLSREQAPERESLEAYSPASSICARIALQAAVAPESLAVIDSSTRLTFAELERRSNQLAAHLREAGARPECCVGLLLERSADFVVAALAVLKTGAAYLPLDSSTPADRGAFILTDARASLLLTHRDKARNLASGQWRVIELDGGDAAQIQTRSDAVVARSGDHATTEARSGDRATTEPAPSSLAYVIYTSGSTGRPKGVEITHANLMNLVEWHQAAFRVTQADRASHVAGLGFDAAVWEIWPHLTAGASLHIADESTRRSPQALHDWLIAEKITISFVPTVLAEQMLHMSWPENAALRILLTGADKLCRRPAVGLPFVLVNNYGPTECTVVATSGTVAPGEDADGPPSIGRPIANASALILDDALRPVNPGCVGELCLAGALVGRGYRNDPQLTASRFVTYSPPSGRPVRVYRTGDRARLLANGEIAFLGRLDDQVKIRGYRIELGEIAASLGRCPGIEACTVTAREDGANGLILVAYVVVSHEGRPTASSLREFLAARLPDYMVPAQYVKIAALPVTPNGKLDKSALPAPAADNLLPNRAAASAFGARASRPPLPPGAGQTALPPGAGETPAFPTEPPSNADDGYQQQVAALVATLLGQPSVEAEENFFMIGGHSMLGALLLVRIREAFGVNLTLRQLFSGPTVAALSAEVARQKAIM